MAGICYLLSKKALTLLGACFLSAGLALGLIQPMGVFLVTERLGLEKEFLKWLLTVYGLGMIVGGGLAAIFAKAAAPQKLLIFGLFFDAIGIGICGISTTLWLTLAGQFISGLKFREGVDVKRAVNIIVWTIEGIAAKEREKAKLHVLDELNYDQILAEVDIHLELLNKSFYK